MGVSIEEYRSKIGSFTTIAPKFNLKNNHEVKPNYKRRKNHKPFKIKFSLLLIFWLFCLMASSQPVALRHTPVKLQPIPITQHLLQPYVPHDVNFEARYKYGNRRRQGINICHWNKWGGYLTNITN